MSNQMTFNTDLGRKEFMRISQDGVWVDPDVPVDEAAQCVLDVLENNIKIIVAIAVKAEREACALLCENEEYGADCWMKIRARGESK